jgi:hypothetical protein
MPRYRRPMRSEVWFIAPKRRRGWRTVKVLEHGPYHDRRPRTWVGPYPSRLAALVAADDLNRQAHEFPPERGRT